MIIDENSAVVMDTNAVRAFFDGDPIDDLDQALDKAAGDLHGDPHNAIYILLKIVHADAGLFEDDGE